MVAPAEALGPLDPPNHPGDTPPTRPKPRPRSGMLGQMSPPRDRLVVGELGPRCASAFAGMTLRAHNRETEITGPIIDQSHLQPLIEGIASLGLALLESDHVINRHTASVPSNATGVRAR
jgi:hypothetical protein